MKLPRKIPATMSTQHPDHAGVPFWSSNAYIHAHEETKECFIAFSELGISEYKWDWEGKLVDESVIERMLSQYHDYFKKNPLGQEKFLTFRLPNPKVETEYRLGRAFTGIISAAGLAKHAGFNRPPLFEVILPMTQTASDMIGIQEAFAELASLKHPLLKHDFAQIQYLEMIPLFEQIEIIANSSQILREYVALHKKLFGKKTTYLRPYVARSDPALNSGLVATVLSIKIALSGFSEFEEKFDIPLFPIIGAGSLPFRGGLSPKTAERFATEYAGIRTTTIQSAFKYDYEKKDVILAIKRLEKMLPQQKARSISKKDLGIIRSMINLFEQNYKSSIQQIAPIVNTVAFHVPRRRERVQHVGLFGYSRGEGTIKLPRAIVFTGALYSIGVPPELIGTGRGIKAIKSQGLLPYLESYYVGLKEELDAAGKFLNKKNLSRLAKSSAVWKGIEEDVKVIEDYIGKPLGPETNEELEHKTITSTIFNKINSKKPLQELVEKSAILRKSIG